MPTKDEHIAALRAAVDAGDTAAANEIAAYLDQNMPSAQQLRQEDWQQMSGAEQALVGAGETLTELGAGIADLLPEGVRDALPAIRVNGQPLTLEGAKQDLAQSKQVDSVAKTLGSGATDLATLLVPGLGTAGRASTLPRALAREAALVGAYEGAKLPDPGESRAGNAALAAGVTAATGAVLPLAVAAAGKTARAVGNAVAPLDPAAQELLDQGVRLTPGMARPGLAPVEKLMTRIPGLGNRTQALQKQALEDWNQQMLKQVTPGGVTKSGSAGFQEAQQNFSNAYNKAWSGAVKDDAKLNAVGQQLAKYHNELEFVTPDYAPLARKTLTKVQANIDGFGRTGNPRYLEKADDLLRDAQYKVDGPDEAFFEGLRKRFHNAVPEDTRTAVQAIDRNYRDFMTLSRAGGYVDASQAGNVFTPRQVLGASKARSSPRQTSAGQGSMQPEAVTASNVMTPPLPRMNASELEESAAPLLAAGALATSPLEATTGLALSRYLVNPHMQGRLTGQIPYEMAKLTRQSSAQGLGGGIGLSQDQYQQMMNELMQTAPEEEDYQLQMADMLRRGR